MTCSRLTSDRAMIEQPPTSMSLPTTSSTAARCSSEERGGVLGWERRSVHRVRLRVRGERCSRHFERLRSCKESTEVWRERLAVSAQPLAPHEERLLGEKKPHPVCRAPSPLREKRHSPSSETLPVETKRRSVFKAPLLATAGRSPVDNETFSLESKPIPVDSETFSPQSKPLPVNRMRASVDSDRVSLECGRRRPTTVTRQVGTANPVSVLLPSGRSVRGARGAPASSRDRETCSACIRTERCKAAPMQPAIGPSCPLEPADPLSSQLSDEDVRRH